MTLKRQDINKLLRLLRSLGLDKRLGIWFIPVALVLLGLLWLAQILWEDYGERLLRAGKTLDCQVEKVYDGDTVTLRCDLHQVKVRVWGIDAPEIGQAPWGQIARDALAERLGPRVKLYIRDQDRYGRTVGQLFHAQEDIALALVQAGHVRVYEQYNDSARYRRAEQQAREAGRGIWQAPGAHQTPWTWRRTQNAERG